MTTRPSDLSRNAGREGCPAISTCSPTAACRTTDLSTEVALVDKERVCLHGVDLHGHVLSPRGPELRIRHTGGNVIAAPPSAPGRVWADFCAGSTPSEKPAYTRPAGKLVRGTNPALDDLAEADFPGGRHTLIEGVEGTADVEVGSMHG